MLKGGRMSEIVFILGAGASWHTGAPLMNNFLDKAEGLLASGQVDDSQEHFQDVFKAIHSLQAVDYKSSLDLDNLEQVFATFEAGKLLHMLGDWPVRRIPRLIVYCLRRNWSFSRNR